MEKGSTRRLKGKAPEVGKRDSVYVGLDVHKHSVHAAVRINGKEHGTAVLPADPRTVLRFLEPYRAGLKSVVYEAGPTGFGLFRVLRGAGMPAKVVAPGKIPRPAVAGAKSDQLDCRKLAEFEEKDLLHEVAAPTPEQEADRQVQRLRDSILKRRRQAKQKIMGFLLQHGLPEPPKLDAWGEAALATLQKMPMSPGLRFSLDLLLEDYYHLAEQLKTVNKRLKELASSQRHAEAIRRLRTHPGVGEVTSMQVLTELYQPRRFNNAKEVAAYVGLAPQIRQSGQTRIEGGTLRGGRGALRATLVEASWMWLRVDKSAGKFYGRLVKNTGSAKKAIVALARKLLVHLWTMLVREEDYRRCAV